MTAADPVSVAMAGIKERAKAAGDFPLAEIAEFTGPDTRSIGGWIAASALDVSRLLKTVEAILEQHQPGRVVIFGSLCNRHENYRFFSITSTEADHVRACPDCAATVYNSCTGCAAGVSVDACTTRKAIIGALAGEETGDGPEADPS